ncbi:uncharacterized protein B0T23DRAFT_408670 [Neurospora hispaniola]|uniref:Uncharacterized protein n=1 Tax=Neurospora hispaniola TaxID=588809 RepID=A0AAJ0HY85_9PEZI|nr:hypothetical protein B0T23DRAFT_408670 [Neurospora hispaniola]
MDDNLCGSHRVCYETRAYVSMGTSSQLMLQPRALFIHLMFPHLIEVVMLINSRSVICLPLIGAAGIPCP